MHELPQLPYDYNALEPHIDAKTMEIHHTKHHQGYVEKLNAALEQYPDLAEHPLDDLLQSLDMIPEENRRAVRNNGGGHYNHSLFWSIMKPFDKAQGKPKGERDLSRAGSREPEADLLDAIKNSFGDFAAFKEEFGNAAGSIFGSGWAWLVVDVDGSLKVTSTSNQDNPVMEGLKPIMCLDVWEHAYYLKYQNKRPDYIEAWWNILNWEYIEQLYIENKS